MKNLLASLYLLVLTTPLMAQINLKIEVLPDNETYLVSFVSDVTYTYPGNVMASGQITLKVPHGVGPNSFQITDLTMETLGAEWIDNSRINAPAEAPSWDYISFGLVTFGTSLYQFTEGVAIPVFSFRNGAGACADSVAIVDNNTDPFYPPNSVGANIGNTVVILGGGLNNVYAGTIGSAKAPCLPETTCTETTFEEVSLCNGQTYMGMAFSQDTLLEYHYTSFGGCDSALFIDIVIDGSITQIIDTAVCEGELFKGIEIFQDEEIMETYTLPSGCDSTVIYQVQLLLPTATTVNLDIVSGQSVYGIPVYSDTTITVNLTGSNGCDSIATTNISIYTIPVSAIHVELCGSEMYNGMSFSQDTTWIDTLSGPAGFDSLVISNIYVYPTYNIINYVSLCEGDEFNGQTYSQDVVLTDQFLTTQACDSIITTVISVTHPQHVSLDTSICQGELYNGYLFNYDTVFTTTLFSANGCDSMVYTTHLHVRPSTYPLITGDLELCAGEMTTLTALGGLEYLWSNGATANTITANESGYYSVTVTNAHNCTAVASAAVSVSALDAAVEVISPHCDGTLDGTIRFEGAVDGVPPYSYSIDGGNFFTTHSEFPYLSPGWYDVRVKDGNGCFWTDSVEITDPEDIFVTLGEDHFIRLGERVELFASTNLFQVDSISWNPETGLDCASCFSTWAAPLETTVYKVTLTDENGCVAEDKVMITVDPSRRVYVPNAFSPNADGVNDFLTVFGDDNVSMVRRFLIFDRWGGLVYSAENFPANDPGRGWNGEYREEPVSGGTFSWKAELEFIDGSVEWYEGSVVVFR